MAANASEYIMLTTYDVRSSRMIGALVLLLNT